jgi:hypothetical protein
MAFITNGGAKLIQRAVQESKAIVFGSIRMNTIYESNPSELVQKPDNWYGENVGQVVGCLSHVSVDGVSCVCDSKLAIQCNDNSKPWKSIGVYGNLEGESGEILLACESIQNGDYKNVTIVELPVTLDGAVEDFGLSEGGGGGGGGDVPAEQSLWAWEGYIGGGTEDEPQGGDKKYSERVSIGIDSNPLTIERDEWTYDGKDDSWSQFTNTRLNVTQREVDFNGLTATWANIINAANSGGGGGGGDVADIRANEDVVQDYGEGNLMVFGDTIQPDYSISVDGMLLTLNSSGYLESVSVDQNSGPGFATIGLIVRDENGNMVANGRISGFSVGSDTPLTFQSPIQLLEGYTITYQAIFSSI